jgi:glycerol-3-phosphate O-acyltransferase
MLTYYRNNLIHHFLNEAFIANALLGLSNIQNVSLGVPVEILWEKVDYLQRLLGNEFVFRKKLGGISDLIQTLNFLQSRGFVILKEETASS